MARPAHQPLRLVLDTNIVVAGLLQYGPPRRLLTAREVVDRLDARLKT